MKHKSPGVTDRLLQSAKEEFLKEGFHGASLRKIAMAAGVSTNSIYVRFSDKKGLFDAVVKEIADQFVNMLSDMNRLTVTEEDTKAAIETSERYTMKTLDFVYDHFDVFKLIFCRSQGSRYEDYLDRLSAEEEKAYRYYIDKHGLQNKVSELFIHEICQSGYRYLAETVAHDLSREEARCFMNEILVYTDAGYAAVLGQ